jgi:hypothetical protein
MRDDVRRFAPVILLFFLSPILGELVSGSAPPVEFFQPFWLLLLGALYGSGAILVREFTVRWGKGWPTIFILGLAYGILEEGLMVKSFFDPNWMDLGLLGTYGRWAGVNWVWTLDLMIYHSVVSIAISIFLVEYLFRERQGKPWLGAKGRIVFFALLVGVTLLGYFGLTSYRPPGLQYLLACVSMLGLIFLARRMPSAWFTTNDGLAKRPLWFGLFGFDVVAVFYLLLMFGFPEMDVPVRVTISFTLIWLVICYWGVRYLSGDGAWAEKHRLALVCGMLTFFAFLAPIQEMDETRPDNTTGMTMVGIALIVFLVWLWQRSVRKNQKVKTESADSSGRYHSTGSIKE